MKLFLFLGVVLFGLSSLSSICYANKQIDIVRQVSLLSFSLFPSSFFLSLSFYYFFFIFFHFLHNAAETIHI